MRRVGICCGLLGLGVAALGAWVAQCVREAIWLWPEWTSELAEFELSPAAPGAIDPCAPVGEDVGKDMAEKGYTVVRQVIGADEARALMDHARSLPFNAYAPGYRLPENGKPPQFSSELRLRLRRVISEIQNASSILVAAPDGNYDASLKDYEFLTQNPADPGNSLALEWHSDFDNFYFAQSLDRFLNMYLVLEKSDPMEAGYTVTPFDTLKQRCSALHDTIYRTAATSWLDLGKYGKTGMMCSNYQTYDKHYRQHFKLDDVSCSPKLAVGDLLIIRGDTPRRTQPPVKAHSTILNLVVSEYHDVKVSSLLEGGLLKYGKLWKKSHRFAKHALAAEFPEVLKDKRAGRDHLVIWPASVYGRMFEIVSHVEGGLGRRLFLMHFRHLYGKWSGKDSEPFQAVYL